MKTGTKILVSIGALVVLFVLFYCFCQRDYSGAYEVKVEIGRCGLFKTFDVTVTGSLLDDLNATLVSPTGRCTEKPLCMINGSAFVQFVLALDSGSVYACNDFTKKGKYRLLIQKTNGRTVCQKTIEVVRENGNILLSQEVAKAKAQAKL